MQDYSNGPGRSAPAKKAGTFFNLTVEVNGTVIKIGHFLEGSVLPSRELDVSSIKVTSADVRGYDPSAAAKDKAAAFAAAAFG